MHIWYDNIKMGIKETNFIFRFNSSLQHVRMQDFGGKLMRLFCIKNKRYKILQLTISEEGFRSVILVDWLVPIILNCRKTNLCLKGRSKILLTQN